MKIQYLGTGGGAGIPEMFCSCRICENARRRQGRELRNRHMAVIDDVLCIDLPCDARSSFLAQGVDAQKIRYLLVTHSHYDHFLADNLISRPEGAQPIELFISRGSGKEIFKKSEKYRNAPVRPGVRPVCAPEIHFVEPFKPFACGSYSVTPLLAHHDPAVESLNYLIASEETAILWLHDTGPLLPQTADYLKGIHQHIQFVSMDCALPYGKYISEEHMDILQGRETIDLLREFGRVDERTLVYLSHIGHLVDCTHEELAKQAQTFGFHAAYDGAVINIGQ